MPVKKVAKKKVVKKESVDLGLGKSQNIVLGDIKGKETIVVSHADGTTITFPAGEVPYEPCEACDSKGTVREGTKICEACNGECKVQVI